MAEPDEIIRLARAIRKLNKDAETLLLEAEKGTSIAQMARGRQVPTRDLVRRLGGVYLTLGLTCPPSAKEREKVRKALSISCADPGDFVDALKRLKPGKLTFARLIARGLEHEGLMETMSLKFKTARGEQYRLYGQLGMLDIDPAWRRDILRRAIILLEAKGSAERSVPTPEEIAKGIAKLRPNKQRLIGLRVAGTNYATLAREFGTTRTYVSESLRRIHRKLGLHRDMGSNRLATLLRDGYRVFQEHYATKET